MKPQDAIDLIKEHLTKLHVNSDIHENGTCNLIDALENHAIPALQKEIPTHPLIKNEFGTQYGRKYYACPNCNEYIRYMWTYEPPAYPACCDECGQALDWENEL